MSELKKAQFWTVVEGESDSEGVAAINKVIDYLTELAEGESDE